MKKNIIILSGKIGVGKDTTCNYITNNYPYYSIAFADKLKETLCQFLNSTYQLNLQVEEFYTEKGKQKIIPVAFNNNIPSTLRGAMQWWGELMKEHLGLSFWIDQVKFKIKVQSINVVISDARFEYEIEEIQKDKALQHNFNIYTVRIVNNKISEDLHISETHLNNYTNYDFILENNSTLQSLYSNIDTIIKTIHNN